MYFTALPDHSKPGFDEHLHFSKFGKHNMVFNAASAGSYCDRHVGCLSLKRVLDGEEWYGVARDKLAVRPGKFLMLNYDQEYSCRIETGKPIRVQSFFFRKDFASAVLRDVQFGEGALLDDPQDTGGPTPEFFQTVYDSDPLLDQRLSVLVTTLDRFGYEAGRVDEHMMFLLRHLIFAFDAGKGIQTPLGSHDGCMKKVEAVKASTRNEIYRRLRVAMDFLHSTYMNRLDLSDVSGAACLSTPQLIRQFKAVFQTTPHQYLTRIRLGVAAGLLRNTTTPIQEITWKCGFADASAFCRVFKAAYGSSPLNYRLTAKRN